MRLLAASAALAALTACAAQEPPPETSVNAAELVETGRKLAQLNCAACHATDYGDESRNAAAPPLRALSERYPGALLADAFPQRMRVGHPAMPDFAFTDENLDALLAYLLTIQERRTT
jgi:mono/diheme cytochrome c family protein